MELLSRMTLVDAAAASLPLDMVMEKAIRQAKVGWGCSRKCSIDCCLACILHRVLCPICVPLGNRKLGAIARMHAGAPRTSAIALTNREVYP